MNDYYQFENIRLFYENCDLTFLLLLLLLLKLWIQKIVY